MPRWPEKNEQTDSRERSTVDDRLEEEFGERQRRSEADKDDPALARFRVPASVLDTDRYVYRAVRDDGMRIHQFETKNYRIMQRDEAVDGERRIRYQHGSSDGKPQFTYLMRKPKEWATEDRQAEQRDKVDTLESSRGLSRKATGQEARQSRSVPGDAGEDAYIPN